MSQQVLGEVVQTLKLRLTSVHDTVRFRTAIPTTQVYVCYLYSLYTIIWSTPWQCYVLMCRDTQIFQKSRSQLKILSIRMVT
jgi:hypothetical protein